MHTITANDEKEDNNNHKSQKTIKNQDKKQESKPQVHFEGTTKSLHGIRKLQYTITHTHGMVTASFPLTLE